MNLKRSVSEQGKRLQCRTAHMKDAAKLRATKCTDLTKADMSSKKWKNAAATTVKIPRWMPIIDG